jgi:dihydroflavonol-4-reductase
MARVFITGATGVVGTDLLGRLLERGDDVVALARSDAAARTLDARGVRVQRGDINDEQAMSDGMQGCDLAFHVGGINKFCVADPGPMLHANVDGAIAAVTAAKRAGVPRLVMTSSAATLGEAHGVIANEWTTPHRGFYLSNYERSKTLGERAAMRTAREIGQDVVYVNPSSVQGPGRAGGTGKFFLAFVDGRLKVFVDTYVSLVDIQDCSSGHLLAAQHGVAGERYLLSGIDMSITQALTLAADVAGVERKPRLAPRPLAMLAASAAEYGFRALGKHPPVCREMVRTLLHGHRYDGSRAQRELGLVYTPARETLQRTIDWARAEGLLRNV